MARETATATRSNLQGTQSPPPSEQHPAQGRQAPSSGVTSTDTGAARASGLEGLESNPADDGPLGKYVQAKTGKPGAEQT